MALQVLKQPKQFKLTDTDSPGTLSNYFSTIRVTTPSAHGLTEDQAVFIRSNFDSYNGIRFVSLINATQFRLKNSPGGDDIAYINGSGDVIAYRYSLLDHGWQCAHLPIVYELESDRYPNNQVQDDYTPRMITSTANEAGYMRLNLAVQLPDPTALSFVQLEDGVSRETYQILRVINNYSIVLNLAYDASFVTSGVLVSTWYNNYAVHINVWCGLPSGHAWESYKPIEIAAELKFVPDANNRVKFSISELIKSYITTRNKLTLDTLPNNIDFWNSFYISYFESWDVSDGTEITTEYFGKDTPGFVPFTLVPLNMWGAIVAGGWLWTGGSNPFNTAHGPDLGPSQGDFLGATSVSFEAGQTYKYAFQFTYSGMTFPVTCEIHVIVADVAITTLAEKVLNPPSSGGVVSDTFEFVCPVGAARLGVRVLYPGAIGALDDPVVTIDSFTDLTPSVPSSTTGIRDSFTGIAVNAKLPFKNINVSALNEYLYAPTSLAKFLVLQNQPTTFVNRFFDISFLNQFEGDLIISIEKKLAGDVIATQENTLSAPGIGVIRAPLEIESGYDQYCIWVSNGYGGQITETLCIDIEGSCDIPASIISGGFVELEGGEFIELEDSSGVIELE
jgi:hypothetical protein